MVDVGRAVVGANRMRASMDELNAAKQLLRNYKGMFGTVWQGEEIRYYINAINDIEQQIAGINASATQLATDYIITASTIRYEEEEAERKAREAAEQAAREAAERAAQEAAAREAAERAFSVISDDGRSGGNSGGIGIRRWFS